MNAIYDILGNWVVWIILLGLVSALVSSTFEKTWYRPLEYLALFAIDVIIILEVIIPNASW